VATETPAAAATSLIVGRRPMATEHSVEKVFENV